MKRALDRRSPRKATSTTTSSRRAKTPPRPKKRKTRSTEPARARARIVFLGLGSNRGDRRARLERAVDEIARRAAVLAVSSFYRAEPVGFADQPEFWNLVVAIAWKGSPAALLREMQAVERIVGRTPSFRNGPREIDVDILDIEGRRRRSRDPILPHPRLAERRFVLAPLAEIAPGWRHPDTGRTAAELLRGLPSRPGVRRLSSRPRGFSARPPGS